MPISKSKILGWRQGFGILGFFTIITLGFIINYSALGLDLLFFTLAEVSSSPTTVFA